MKFTKVQIIGGTFSKAVEERKMSSVISKLENNLRDIFNTPILTYGANGGSINKLKQLANSIDANLTIWMPNVSNEEEKIYPKKPKGSILICSKVLRKNRTIYDAVGRIFKMHGNAVIAIEKTTNKFVFTLLDALGNGWVRTSDISTLAKVIFKFYTWTQGVKRIGSTYTNLKHSMLPEEYANLRQFCKLNTLVADKVENGSTNRYFGNCSTRCALMFPSMRSNDGHILVSRRNSNKKRLEASDMVVVYKSDKMNTIRYEGDKQIKPSVDTPIQLELYKKFSKINYMIHGHAYIDDKYSMIPFTESYFSCGDLREAKEVEKYIVNASAYAVNLRNHGFLLYSETLYDLKNFINKVNFIPKEVGKEFI
jgi:hypothetical protein